MRGAWCRPATARSHRWCRRVWGRELARRVLAPLFFTLGTRFSATRHELFRVLSQIRIRYADSLLSEGEAGDVKGGDRLPWIGGSPDNFAPLASLDWQAHVYGVPRADLAQACERAGIPLHTFAWNDRAKDVGLERDAMYVVRPDGYVGLAASTDTASDALDAYVRRLALRPSSGGAA